MLNLSHHGLWIAYVHFEEPIGMCRRTGMRNAYLFFQAPSTLSEATIKSYRSSHTNFSDDRYWKSHFNKNALLNPGMIYGAVLEPIRINLFLFSVTRRSTYTLSLVLRR